MKIRLHLFFILALALFLYSPSPLLIAAGRKAPVEEILSSDEFNKQDSPEETTIPLVEKENTNTLIYALHPEGEFEALLDLLKENPQIRLTLIIPPDYFDFGVRKERVGEFKTLISSHQIEIAMTLKNEPNLPLLADLRLAKGEVDTWDAEYAWPEDISLQLAKGSGEYKTNWGLLPSGFVPPYFSISPDVKTALKGFRLNWVLTSPDPSWGVVFDGPTAYFIPNVDSSHLQIPEGSKDWAVNTLNWTLKTPFAYVDGSKWHNKKSELLFFEALRLHLTDTQLNLITAAELSQSNTEEFELPKETKLPLVNSSLWAQTDGQRRAWKALSEARDVVDKYKNSGRANLRMLDAAMDEIMTAESGPFLYALGQTVVPLTQSERNFIATLANVYRLCGVAIPPELNRTFSTSKWKKAKTLNNKSDLPFFVKNENSLTWNDPLNDDKGGGAFTYPTGRYPKGSFDLTTFTLSWDNLNVTFAAAVNNIPDKNTLGVMPLVDVYISVNRIANAGSVNGLAQRGPISLDREAAWEFALTMGPYTSSLVQSIIGENPRRIEGTKPRVHGDGKSFSVSVPRKIIKGDPKNWRLSVGLAGSEITRTGQSSLPVPILGSPGLKNFAGAVSGKTPPAYVDLLAPTVDDQADRINSYEIGRKVDIPYVEAE